VKFNKLLKGIKLHKKEEFQSVKNKFIKEQMEKEEAAYDA